MVESFRFDVVSCITFYSSLKLGLPLKRTIYVSCLKQLVIDLLQSHMFALRNCEKQKNSDWPTNLEQQLHG